eukprot:NODE_353_length_8928_cov_0.455204.p3 type:complete len:253 gc:universal NODE_353_length_8928_cov_0.455204:4031-3273(-)
MILTYLITAYELFNLQEMNCEMKDHLNYTVNMRTFQPRYILKQHSCNLKDNPFELETHGIQTMKQVFTKAQINELYKVKPQQLPELIVSKYCELVEEFFKSEFKWTVLCVDLQFRDVNQGILRETIQIFHRDQITTKFKGIRLSIDSKFNEKNNRAFNQPETFNLWINLGSTIKNHNLNFMSPCYQFTHLRTTNVNIMRPVANGLDVFEFNQMEKGNAIVFVSSYLYHASIYKQNCCKYRRRSIEFRVKKLN